MRGNFDGNGLDLEMNQSNPSLKETRGPSLWVTEPFRVFLPLGVAASIMGVLIWPLFYAGLWKFPPPLQHPRFMIYGFGFAFIAGFLGTAWPRFLDAKPLKRIELILLVSTWLLTQVLCGLNQIRYTDAAFSLQVLTLIIILASRLIGRVDKSLPPPGFLLAFGSVSAAFVISLSWAITPGGLPPKVYLFTKLFLWQGLLLLPILGVGSYLFARIFQEPDKEAVTAKPHLRKIGVWVAAALIIGSFAIEASGWIRTGNLIRFSAVLIWLGMAAPAVWKGAITSTRARALRLAIGSIALSFFVRSIWPGPGYALVHLLFISGFGMTMLLVADRVTLGHSDQLESQPSKSKLWRWLIGLILLAAATRASADFKASILVSHHIYAALIWAIVAVIFWVKVGKFWWNRNVT